jgi:hypothetical protein
MTALTLSRSKVPPRAGDTFEISFPVTTRTTMKLVVRLLRHHEWRFCKDELMAEGINRDEVQTLARNGAQVVEVLGAKEYEHAHIAGAINVPLAKLNRESASVLIRDRMVIVYCYDYQ